MNLLKLTGVPVSAAQEISEKFDKDIVVIVCYDRMNNTTDTVTYGRGAVYKDVAVDWSELFAKTLGSVPREYFEDYRATPAAEYKHQIDAMRAVLRDMLSYFQHSPGLYGALRERIEAVLNLPCDTPKTDDAPVE